MYGLTQSAVSVNASQTGATAANSASLRTPTTAMTYEFWFKTPATLPTSYFEWVLGGLCGAAGFGGTAGNAWFMRFIYVSNTTWQFVFTTSNGTSGGQTAGTNWSPTANTWYHIAYVYTSTPNLKIFINGVQLGSTVTSNVFGPLNQPSSVHSPFFVFGGGSDGSTDSATGNVSLARLWSTDQSANLATNMCSVLGSGTGLLAEWTLNNTLADNTGNSNTLTNLNSFAFATDTPSTCASVAVVHSLMSMGMGS